MSTHATVGNRALRIALLTATVALFAPRAQAQLPTQAVATKPAMHLVIDSSGSMEACDGLGRELVVSQDLTPVAGGVTGQYLYNPRTMENGGCANSGPDDGAFPITRMQAVKWVISKVLDADRSGTIDTIDEEIIGIKMGVSHFDGQERSYATDRDTLLPIGTPYADIWNMVRNIRGNGYTPTAPATAGARALSIANCFDGDVNTPCNLGPEQTDENGDDVASCREYFIVVLTDGEPNQDSRIIPEDPVLVSKLIAERQKIDASEADAVIGPEAVRVIGIGLGEAVTGLGSGERGLINCMTYWGSIAMGADNRRSEAADSDTDADDNMDTMDDDLDPMTAGLDITTAPHACDPATYGAQDYDNIATEAKYYGNGYFADDGDALIEAFLRILNAIAAGTFTRSEPTLHTTGTSASTDAYAYSAIFTVDPDEKLYQGDLKSFRLTQEGFVDCDVDDADEDVVVPCWSAGILLRDRLWDTRVMYFVNPDPAKFQFHHELDGSNKSSSWIGDTTNVNRNTDATLVNMVPLLGTDDPSTVNDANIETYLTSAAGGLYETMYRWAQMSTLLDPTETKEPDGSGAADDDALSPGELLAAYQSFAFATGRPRSLYLDGTRRGGDLADGTTPVWKLADSYNSRPVVIGPPVGVVTDRDYIDEFRKRPLTDAAADARSLDHPFAYDTANAPRAVNADGTARIVSPCYDDNDVTLGEAIGLTVESVPAEECVVEKRRTVTYLAANDGAVHAFDEATGHEIWSFVPPGHMYRLQYQRERRTAYIDGLPVVRDVKFPCKRATDGSCDPTTDAMADGKWHTLLIYNQGPGGNFFFALDVTNPVAPVFLWEFKSPDKMGFTIGAATVGEIPNGASGLPDLTDPGSLVFAPGGYDPNDGITPHLFSLRVDNATVLHEEATTPSDLDDLVTSPGGLVNGLVGSPRAIDGNLDGDIDRVFFGDREGRMWKACDITSAGKFDTELFFDPALYDYYDTDGDGLADDQTGPGSVGRPLDVDDPTSGASTPDARKRLRGPVYFAADVTRDQTGQLIVVFGSGNILDPLSAPKEYYNFIWSVGDDPSVDGTHSDDAPGGPGCGAALVNRCTAGTVDFEVSFTEVTPPPTPTPLPPPPPCPCQAAFTEDDDGTIDFTLMAPDETGLFQTCFAAAKPTNTPPHDPVEETCYTNSCPRPFPTPPPRPASWDDDCGPTTGIHAADFTMDTAGNITVQSCYMTEGSGQDCEWRADEGRFDCDDDCRNDSRTYCEETVRDYVAEVNTYRICKADEIVVAAPPVRPDPPPTPSSPTFSSGYDNDCGRAFDPDDPEDGTWCSRCFDENSGDDIEIGSGVNGSTPRAGDAGNEDSSDDCPGNCGNATEGVCDTEEWSEYVEAYETWYNVTLQNYFDAYEAWEVANVGGNELIQIADIVLSPTPYQPQFEDNDAECDIDVDTNGAQVTCDEDGDDCSAHDDEECEKLETWYEFNSIPQANCPCAYATPAPTPTPAPVPPPAVETTTFAGLVPLHELLSAPPLIFNKLLFYAEFQPGDACGDTPYLSRVYNRDVFTCGRPPDGAAVFSDDVMDGQLGKEYVGRLVTGLEISPSHGLMVIQSTPTTGTAPGTEAGDALKVPNAFAGWRQID